MFKKHKKAFTLIEVLVASTIFAIVMVMVASILSWASAYNIKLKEIRKVNQDGRKILNSISDDVRQANGSTTIIGHSDISIGELAIVSCLSGSAASCNVNESYQQKIDEEIDLSNNQNVGLIIVNKKNNKLIYYQNYTGSKFGDIDRYEIEYKDKINISDFYDPNVKSTMNDSKVDLQMGFAGYTPKREINERNAQPIIKVKVLSQSADYDQLQKNYRSKINFETSISTREYNVFE